MSLRFLRACKPLLFFRDLTDRHDSPRNILLTFGFGGGNQKSWVLICILDDLNGTLERKPSLLGSTHEMLICRPL